MRHGYEQRAALWNEFNGATLALRHAQDRHERALRAIEDALIAAEMEPQGTPPEPETAAGGVNTPTHGPEAP